MLPNLSRKKTCGLRLCNNYHMMGYNLGAKAVSRSVRNYKLLDPYEDMHRMFDLFVLYRKTCSSPSVLVIDICVESRIWPRIESGPLQCLWLNDPPPIWKFPVSVLRQRINNLIKSHSARKEGRDLRRRKSMGMFFNQVVANPPLSFPVSLHHEPIRAWEWPESRQGRMWWKTWILTFTLSNSML